MKTISRILCVLVIFILFIIIVNNTVINKKGIIKTKVANYINNNFSFNYINHYSDKAGAILKIPKLNLKNNI